MKHDLNYSVILTIEFYSPEVPASSVKPKKSLGLTMTECNICEWFLNDFEVGQPTWLHRKWVGVLDQTQWDQLIDQYYLTYDGTPNMGALGTPAFPMSLAPAIIFRVDESDLMVDAWVTPFPVDSKIELTDELWNEIEDHLKEKHS